MAPTKFSLSMVLFTLLPLVAAVTLASCSQRPPTMATPAPRVTVGQPRFEVVTNWDEYPGHLEAVEMVDAVLKDKKKVLPCAAYLQGEGSVRTDGIHVPRTSAKSPRPIPRSRSPSRPSRACCTSWARGMLRG